jgi:hypothetical protein
MAGLFKKARRSQARLRLCLAARSGRGKSLSSLRIAVGITQVVGGRIAVIDTERDSASIYGSDDDRHHDDRLQYDFDSINLTKHHPEAYVLAIKAAEAEKDAAGNFVYSVIIIDSLTHAWESDEGGALALHAAEAAKSGNSYTAWRAITPTHNKLINAMLNSRCHIIGTMRTKVAHEVQTDDRGKMVPVKIGLKPIQREGMDYEFTITADIDEQHRLIVDKTRWSEIDGHVEAKPGPDFGVRLANWLQSANPEQADSPVMVKAMAAVGGGEAETVEPTAEQARKVAGPVEAGQASAPDTQPTDGLPALQGTTASPGPVPAPPTQAERLVETLAKPAAPPVPAAAPTPTGPEPPAAFFADVPARISSADAAEMADIFAALTDNKIIGPDALHKALHKREVSRIQDLTSEQAGVILATIRKKAQDADIVVARPTLRDTLPAAKQGGPLPGAADATANTPNTNGLPESAPHASQGSQASQASQGAPTTDPGITIAPNPTRESAEKPAPKRAARAKKEAGPGELVGVGATGLNPAPESGESDGA